MTSITCPCAECIHHGKDHKCTAKAVKLSYRNMATVHEGRVHMWVCDHYELTDEAIKAAEMFAELAKRLNAKMEIDKGRLPVRHCADCNHYIQHGRLLHEPWCGYWGHKVDADDFCSRAEERPE